jgi:hypothetical protein
LRSNAAVQRSEGLPAHPAGRMALCDDRDCDGLTFLLLFVSRQKVMGLCGQEQTKVVYYQKPIFKMHKLLKHHFLIVSK